MNGRRTLTIAESREGLSFEEYWNRVRKALGERVKNKFRPPRKIMSQSL